MVDEALLSAMGVLLEEKLNQKLDEKLEPIRGDILRLHRQKETGGIYSPDCCCSIRLSELERRVHALEAIKSQN